MESTSVKNKATIIAFSEVEVGDTFSFKRTITKEDVIVFANLTGDQNPLHVNQEFAEKSNFGKNVVHGMLTASLFSTLIGMYCPGEKGLLLGQTLQFKLPLFYGENVEVKGTIINKIDAYKIIKIKTEIYRGPDLILTGETHAQFLEE